MPHADRAEDPPAEDVLRSFGYRQEFQRKLKRFASFAVVFSFISITTGIFTVYGSELNWGGPLGVWTWPIVVLGRALVALVFAALASRIPLAGYSYQWASRLANPPVGWLIGWVSFTFLIVSVVTVDYSLAQTVLPRLLDYAETPGNAWLIAALVIAVQLALLLFSTPWSTRMSNVAAVTEVVGIAGLTVLLITVGAARGTLHPDHLFSTGTIPARGYFRPGTLTSVGPFFLSFLIGIVCIIGFEAAANLAEETENAQRVVPIAMLAAVLLSGVIGMAFLIALNLASGNLHALAASATPVADIVRQTLGRVVGDVFLALVTFSFFACGLVVFLTATRLVWAMSRDRRFPGYRLTRKVDERTHTPLVATALCGTLMEAVLALFANHAATLQDLFSTTTIQPLIIYLATVILYACTRRSLPRSRGFSLGAFEWPVVALALAWLVFELSIFRDSSFITPWLYTLVMFAIGVLYFLFMLLTRQDSLKSNSS
jgi:amino acid transporter